MGKIVRYFSILLMLIIGATLLLRHSIGDTKSALFKIFNSEVDGYRYHKVIGLIPKEVLRRYSKQVLDSINNIKLVNFIDKRSPIEANYIVLENEMQESFLKAYPSSLLSKKDTLFKNSDYVSHLIDLDVFNQYLKLFHICKKAEIEKAYCLFLSKIDKPDSHLLLTSMADLDSINNTILNDSKKKLNSLGYNVIDINSVTLETTNDVTYCWFEDKGLVKFYFTVGNCQLLNIRSETIGYLGNEFPSCC